MQLNSHGFKGERQSVFAVLFHSQTTFVGFVAHSSLCNGQISFYYLASHYEEGNTRIELHITKANYHAKRMREKKFGNTCPKLVEKSQSSNI